MMRLNISKCLATKQNEQQLRMFFCSLFDECAAGKSERDDELNFYVRLILDLRAGVLFIDTFMLEESAAKQLYQRYGDVSFDYMPIASTWVNGSAPALHQWETTDLYPASRLENAGWREWRADAEAFISTRYDEIVLNRHSPEASRTT